VKSGREPDLLLASPPRPSHNAGMAETHEFTTAVESDFDRPGRFRWSVSEDRKVRDKSLFSFATRREAQADVDRFVEKLNVTWRREQGPPGA
jgi:hypothetical protein